jgi:1-acyl-sn-glycerol-3-phosphate acyltransferase
MHSLTWQNIACPHVSIWNMSALFAYFAPLLRPVVFIGKPTAAQFKSRLQSELCPNLQAIPITSAARPCRDSQRLHQMWPAIRVAYQRRAAPTNTTRRIRDIPDRSGKRWKEVEI